MLKSLYKGEPKIYGKDTTKSTFDQLFEAFTSFTQNLKDRKVDKYIKIFTLLKFILLMSFTQLNQLKSLRDISSNLDDEKLAELLVLTSNSDSPPDFSETSGNPIRCH